MNFTCSDLQDYNERMNKINERMNKIMIEMERENAEFRENMNDLWKQIYEIRDKMDKLEEKRKKEKQNVIKIQRWILPFIYYPSSKLTHSARDSFYNSITKNN